MYGSNVFGPFTITVYLPDDRALTVSAFCPVCCNRRLPYGPAPAVGLAQVRGGRRVRFVAWMNPCGHLDTAEGLIAEEARQCAAPGCVLRAFPPGGLDDLPTSWPYCSAECACGATQLVE